MTVALLQVVMEAPFPVDHGRTTELALCPRLSLDVYTLEGWGELGADSWSHTNGAEEEVL